MTPVQFVYNALLLVPHQERKDCYWVMSPEWAAAIARSAYPPISPSAGVLLLGLPMYTIPMGGAPQLVKPLFSSIDVSEEAADVVA